MRSRVTLGQSGIMVQQHDTTIVLDPTHPVDCDFTFVSHAHVDHSGLLPRLHRQGFRGRVYCTRATLDLCTAMLRDSAHIQEKDAEYANRRGFSKHKPAKPLYTQAEAEAVGGADTMSGNAKADIVIGGVNNGMACTPETTALNAAYPTSHDCPPPSGTFIGALPIPFNLSTGTQTKTSFATAAQMRVFCGFCFDPNVSSAFANPPDPCTSDAECAARGDFFDSCQQHSNGAFRNPFATTITETGGTDGMCIGDGALHSGTLVSVFCIPPSYNVIVDPSAGPSRSPRTRRAEERPSSPPARTARAARASRPCARCRPAGRA